MNTSQQGIELIKKFEGIRYQAYDDGVGVWTIGVGHTKGVVKGDKIDDAKVDEYLREDLESAEYAVNSLVKVELRQTQFDALVSLVFNIGSGAFASSTLLKMLNKGSLQAAADQFPRWNMAGGKVLRGLVARRAAERLLFLS
jgi:lysozyme